MLIETFDTKPTKYYQSIKLFFQISKFYSLAPVQLTPNGKLEFQNCFILYSYLFLIVNFGLLIHTVLTKPDNSGFREWVNKSENIELAAVTFALHFMGITSRKRRANCFQRLYYLVETNVGDNIEPNVVKKIIIIEFVFIGFFISLFYAAYSYGMYLYILSNNEHLISSTIGNNMRLIFWTCVILNEFQYINCILLLKMCYGGVTRKILRFQVEKSVFAR